MSSVRVEYYKELLKLEGFRSECIDQAEIALELLIKAMDEVESYPVADATIPAFNPNPYVFR